MKRGITCVLVALAGLLGTGCFDEVGCSCDAAFRIVSIEIVDVHGTPVDGLDATATLDATGAVAATGQWPSGAGLYLIGTDQTPGIDDHAQVTLYASSATSSVEGHFLIGWDSCNCHLHKLAGPDSLVVPADYRIVIEPIAGWSEDLLVSFDGQTGTTLAPGESVEVCRAEHRVCLIRLGEEGFFGRMRQKLHWGDLSGRELKE